MCQNSNTCEVRGRLLMHLTCKVSYTRLLKKPKLNATCAMPKECHMCDYKGMLHVRCQRIPHVRCQKEMPHVRCQMNATCVKAKGMPHVQHRRNATAN